MQGRVVKSLSDYEQRRILVAPSLLASDFSRLREEVDSIASGGAELLHIDVMDGHFVPNLSMGPGLVSSLRRCSDLLFDVHLMLSEPGRYIESFARAGADLITVHVESSGRLDEVLAQIRATGCGCGITLRPGTPACAVFPYLPLVDMVLVMTVEPGFGGQSFMSGQLPKIRQLREAIDGGGLRTRLEVDGGVAPGTADKVLSAGGDILVAGSSVFRSPLSRAEAISCLRGGF